MSFLLMSPSGEIGVFIRRPRWVLFGQPRWVLLVREREQARGTGVASLLEALPEVAGKMDRHGLSGIAGELRKLEQMFTDEIVDQAAERAA